MFETRESRFRRLLPPILYAAMILILAVLGLRALDFLQNSLAWPVAICLDASILRFESWSMLNGVWPWRDIVSINLPVTHYIHILGMAIFGEDDRGFRLLDAAYIFATALLTGLYLLRHSKLAGGIGFCLVLCLPHEATPYGAFQREVLMLPLWLFSLWIAENLYERLASPRQRSTGTASAKKAWPWFLLGVLAVLSVAIKPTSALLFLFFGLAFVITAFRTNTTAESLAILTRGLFFSLLAALLTAGAVFAPLFIADGNLPAAFVESWLNQTGAYAAVVKTTAPFELFKSLFTFSPINWSFALNQPLDGPADTGHFSLLHITLFVLWFLFAFRGGRSGRSVYLALFALAALLQYVLQMRGFQYHLYPLWYAWVLATAYVLSDLMQSRETDGLRAAALFFGLSLLLQQHNSLSIYKGTGLYDTAETVPNFKTPGEITRITAAINDFEKRRARLRNRGKKPEDQTPPPQLYFQTFEHATIALGAAIPNELRLASRYPVDYIVWEDSKYREPARKEMLTALQERKPAFIAYSAGHTPEEKQRLAAWPELNRWIRRGYRRTKVITEVNKDEYWIFVRRDYAYVARPG